MPEQPGKPPAERLSIHRKSLKVCRLSLPIASPFRTVNAPAGCAQATLALLVAKNLPPGSETFSQRSGSNYHYQTSPHPGRYSDETADRRTLERLWIVRTFHYVPDRNSAYRAGCLHGGFGARCPGFHPEVPQESLEPARGARIFRWPHGYGSPGRTSPQHASG